MSGARETRKFENTSFEEQEKKAVLRSELVARTPKKKDANVRRTEGNEDRCGKRV